MSQAVELLLNTFVDLSGSQMRSVDFIPAEEVEIYSESLDINRCMRSVGHCVDTDQRSRVDLLDGFCQASHIRD